MEEHLLMKNIPYTIDNNFLFHILSLLTRRMVRMKRDRITFRDYRYFYKCWIFNDDYKRYNHQLNVSCGFTHGFYDDQIAPVFKGFIIKDGREIGYAMHKGKSLKTLGDLIKLTNYRTRRDFMLSLLNKTIQHKATYPDLTPQNMVIYKNRISLIDYEEYRSLNWLFNKIPEPWEAKDRDLSREPHPLWIKMDKYYKDYFYYCLNIEVKKDINSMDSIKLLRELIINT